MKKGATTFPTKIKFPRLIIALRNEKGSYNQSDRVTAAIKIIALRNEKGSYN